MNVDLEQADDDLEGSEEELEVAGREWRRMEERSLKEGFRSDAVLQPSLVFEPTHTQHPLGDWIIGLIAGREGAQLKRKLCRRVLTRATRRVSPGPNRLAG